MQPIQTKRTEAKQHSMLTRLCALGLCCLLAGCNTTSPATGASKPAMTTPKQAAVVTARPTVAPPAFKLFHAHDSSFILVTSEHATDDQIASILWQLHDAAQSNSFQKLKISQKAVDARNPNADFLIYRGTKCAAERYADGPPPCGAAVHAAGSYNLGSYANPKWDTASITDANGNMTTLWGSN